MHDNIVTVDFDTKLQALGQRTRVDKVRSLSKKAKIIQDQDKKIPSILNSNNFDWTTQIFNKGSNENKTHNLISKNISREETWVDYLLVIHFGVLAISKQLAKSINMDADFTINLWIRYLKYWKQQHIVSSFTTQRHGNLKHHKNSQLKRFEKFDLQKLEEVTQNLKFKKLINGDRTNEKENIEKLKQTFLHCKYESKVLDENSHSRRKNKERKKLDTKMLEMFRTQTDCYNSLFYSKFKSNSDVFNLKIYPELDLISRAMIYIQRKYPLDKISIIKNLDPVSLIRNSKYKSGKLLKIQDRTYTIQILATIMHSILKSLKLTYKLNFHKFISTKLKAKEKLILSIFFMDLVNWLYENSYKRQSYDIVEFSRNELKENILDQYIDMVENKDDATWCSLIAESEV